MQGNTNFSFSFFANKFSENWSNYWIVYLCINILLEQKKFERYEHFNHFRDTYRTLNVSIFCGFCFIKHVATFPFEIQNFDIDLTIYNLILYNVGVLWKLDLTIFVFSCLCNNSSENWHYVSSKLVHVMRMSKWNIASTWSTNVIRISIIYQLNFETIKFFNFYSFCIKKRHLFSV